MVSTLSLAAEEKLVLTMSRDGGVHGMEVKGDLQLLVADPAYCKAVAPLAMGPNAGYQFKTHPNINKAAFSSNSTLTLKDPSRGFPVGSAVGVLKWRQVADDPPVFSCPCRNRSRLPLPNALTVA